MYSCIFSWHSLLTHDVDDYFHLLPPYSSQQPWSTQKFSRCSKLLHLDDREPLNPCPNGSLHLYAWIAEVRTKSQAGLLNSDVLYQITSRCNLKSSSLLWIIQLEGRVAGWGWGMHTRHCRPHNHWVECMFVWACSLYVHVVPRQPHLVGAC